MIVFPSSSAGAAFMRTSRSPIGALDSCFPYLRNSLEQPCNFIVSGQISQHRQTRARAYKFLSSSQSLQNRSALIWTQPTTYHHDLGTSLPLVISFYVSDKRLQRILLLLPTAPIAAAVMTAAAAMSEFKNTFLLCPGLTNYFAQDATAAASVRCSVVASHESVLHEGVNSVKRREGYCTDYMKAEIIMLT